MDNNGAERAIRPGALGRKNYYGSASRWSAQLLAMMLTLLQTLVRIVRCRDFLNASVGAKRAGRYKRAACEASRAPGRALVNGVGVI
jgi:Transposase IS66 family